MYSLSDAEVGSKWAKDEPVSNAPAVVSIKPDSSGERVAVDQILFSYDGLPSGGCLCISESGERVVAVSVVEGGGGFVPLKLPYIGKAGAEVVITLSAGGEMVSGKLNVQYR